MKTGVETIINVDQDETVPQYQDLDQFEGHNYESTSRQRSQSARSNNGNRSSLSLMDARHFIGCWL